MSGDHREVPTGALQGAQPPASCFPRAPGMAGWLTRDAAPTPLPPAHNCPQTLHAHSDARTAQGLQGTRPIFMSKLVFLGGRRQGGQGAAGEPRATSARQLGWARPLLVDKLAQAIHGSPLYGQCVATPRNTQSRGVPSALKVGVWWTGEGALLAPGYPCQGAGPPVA